MERFNALGRGTQIMLVAGVLLIIDSFFRWQEVEFDLGDFGSGSAGVNAWDDFLGIVMGILTIVLIARIVARLAAVEIRIPVSYAMTSAVLALLIFVAALLKNVTDDFSTFWSYVGIVLAFLIAAGAWIEVKAAGGIDTLKSEIPGAGAAGAGQSASTDAPAPAASEPAAEAAPEPAPAERESTEEEPSTEREA